MTNEMKMQLHRIYGIVYSISIVIAGICLMAGCLTIYDSGDHPFSREVVAETFSGIALPVYICLVLTIISFVMHVIMPTAKAKPVMQRPYATMLKRLYLDRDISQCETELQEDILKLQKERRTLSVVRSVVLVIAGAAFLVYALNGSHFVQSDINNSMIHAMWVLIPCLAVSFGVALFANVKSEHSLQKEMELVKQIPAQGTTTATETETCECKKVLVSARVVILGIGIACVVFGFCTGGTVDVLTKAINICTECIGLG